MSISGRDRVGKTEQISLLKGDRKFHFTGHLVDHSDRWAKLGPVESFNWWFRDLPFLDLVSIILESLKARRSTYKPDKININDRGSRMFKAVCAATMVTREIVSFDEAVGIIDKLFEKEIVESELEQEILFKSDSKYLDSIRHLFQFVDAHNDVHLPWQTEMYAKYQTSLAQFMDHYYRDISPDRLIHVNDCILDVHCTLRKKINDICSTDLQFFCDNVNKLVAFGGLSESGKSSFAERLRTHHNFCRLKIKYFGGVVEGCGLKITPTTIGRELSNFFQDHRHISYASIESVHGPDLPAYLKLLFGSRFKIVYLDAPEEVRVSRTAETLGISQNEAKISTVEKDSIKLSRGANKVKDIADVVVNNGSDDFETVFNTFFGKI